MISNRNFVRFSVICFCTVLLGLTGCGETTQPEAKTIYVHSTVGLDTNPGTLEKPLKTIKKALELWKPKAEVVLMPSVFSELSGEVWPYEAPAGLVVRAAPGAAAGAVVLECTATDTESDPLKKTAFILSPNPNTDPAQPRTEVLFENLHLKNFFIALHHKRNQASLNLNRVEFEENHPKPRYYHAVIVSNTDAWLDIKDSSLKNASIQVKDTAIMNLSGSSLEGTYTISLSNTSRTNLSNVQSKGSAASGDVFVGGNATVSISNSTLVSTGNVLYLYGSGKATITNDTLTSTTSSTIRVDGGSLGVFEATKLFSPEGYGIEVIPYAPNPVDVVVSGADDPNILITGKSGIVMGSGTAKIWRTKILATSRALDLGAGVTGFQLYKCVLETNNEVGNAIHLEKPGSYDFGYPSAPGNNIFRNTSGKTHRGLLEVSFGPGSVSMSGNTWEANKQGADVNGNYKRDSTAVGPQSDANFYIREGTTMYF